jgi:hypothetical protein
MQTDSGSAMKRELLDWLDEVRAHVADQVRAMPAEARRRSVVPSGWTPRGLVRHLALDVERVWFRAVMAGEQVDRPQGYDGWTAPEAQSDEELLEQYAEECSWPRRPSTRWHWTRIRSGGSTAQETRHTPRCVRSCCT